MFWRVFVLSMLGLVNIVLFARMLWGPTGLIEYHALQSQFSSMQNEIASLDRHNLALSREIRLLQSDGAYVEKMIRQNLHYMRDDEVLYLFGNDAGKEGQGASRHD